MNLFLPEFSNLDVPAKIKSQALALAAEGQQAYDGAFGLTRQAVGARASGHFRDGAQYMAAAGVMNKKGDALFIQAWQIVAKARNQ